MSGFVRAIVRPHAPAVVYAVVLALALTSLYGLGLAMRRHVVGQQLPERGRPLPFTMESAVQFRSIRTLYTEGSLPVVDPEIQIPGGIRTFEHDTVGMEYVVAWLARLFPAEITLTDRVRWISVAWFCLGIPLMAVWIRRAGGSWGGGWSPDISTLCRWRPFSVPPAMRSHTRTSRCRF